MKKMLKKPTFLIQMLDNQNMTWQGTITYLETNQKLPFRSLLELLKLMDSAISPAEYDQNLNVISGFSGETIHS
ncbi:MAG: hypothetical protein FWH28_08330 [Clostridiales bacterium]|nr:hypothetical protein [Clostridiales bacterium]